MEDRRAVPREIDGSPGGGQLLRTALGLSAATGDPFRMTGVRAARPNPGLRPQHLAAVRAVAAACDASVEGAALGSTELTFRPGAVRGGDVVVDVATAGSVTLVCDALLPLAVVLDAPLRATIRGGTDVKWSPPFAYAARVKLPLLAGFGLDADLSLARTGFYPAGGGEVTLTLRPSTLAPIRLVGRGGLRRVSVVSTASTGLRGRRVAERQADAAEEALAATALGVDDRDVRYARTASPGSSLVVAADYERTAAGASALGERGTPAETVGRNAAAALVAFHRGPAAVDRHLADQVVPFLALAGGEVTIPEATRHVTTGVALVREFGFDVEIREGEPPRLVGRV